MNYNEQLRQKIDAAEQRRCEAEAMIRSAIPQKRTGFAEFMRDMLFGLGLKNIFYGIYDAAAVTATIAGILIALLGGMPAGVIGTNISIYGLVFAFSPLVFFVFFLLSYIKERTEGSIEVKMTCRYTALHLCAFRMFLCGIFCMIVNAVAVLVVSVRSEADFAGLLAVSFSSLFLFALLMILSLLRLGARGCIIPAAVMAVCAVLSVFPWYDSLLKSIPASAYAVLGAVLLITFQSVLNKINRRYGYAVR